MIFKYLKGIIDLGLWYPNNISFDLLGYTNADFAGCLTERKNTNGTCYFLGNSLALWVAKRKLMLPSLL